MLLLLAACNDGGSKGDVVITADVTSGTWPLTVAFDGADSTAEGDFAWDFGDGAVGTGEEVDHTYVGEGSFTVTLTVGEALATTTIEVDRPACPDVRAPQSWGMVTDPELTEISGLAQSSRDPEVLWVVEDAQNPEELVAIDTSGAVLGRFELDDQNFSDVEDLASGLDPVTGEPKLYAADLGNNDDDKTEFAIWTFDEPENPSAGGLLSGGKRTVLKYPTVALDSETLLVDPLTEDFYFVTKDNQGEARVFKKTAPHQGGGPFELEYVTLIDFSKPPLTGSSTTGGAISSDGQRVVIRTYSDRAWMWRIDGYLPFGDVFDTPPCEIQLAEEAQGESITFANDGSGVLTVGELANAPVWFVPFGAN